MANCPPESSPELPRTGDSRPHRVSARLSGEGLGPVFDWVAANAKVEQVGAELAPERAFMFGSPLRGSPALTCVNLEFPVLAHVAIATKAKELANG